MFLIAKLLDRVLITDKYDAMAEISVLLFTSNYRLKILNLGSGTVAKTISSSCAF